MADRDDANLAQFKSRAKNKKVVEAPVNPTAAAPVQVFIVLDGHRSTDQTDICGWTHIGTSPRVTPIDAARSRRRIQMFMGDA
jgi:hypothetical protein